MAVEAGREVLPGTEMGTFSAMAPTDGKRARRLGFTYVPELTDAVEARVPAAVIRATAPRQALVWNFRWAVPAIDDQPYVVIEGFESAVRACYRQAKATATMEVLVRKDRCDERKKATTAKR